MKKIIGKLQKIASNWGVSTEENLSVVFLQQGWGTPGIDLDQRNNPLCCGGKHFAWGFGTHAPSRIRIGSGAALQRFVCSVGVAQNDFTGKESSRISPVVFSVEVNGKSVFTSAALKYGEVARLSVDLPDAFSFDLVVNYADGFGHGGHVNWCEPEVLASDGKTIRCTASEYPFPMDFNYGKMSAGTFLHLYPLKHAVQEKEDHFLHVCTAASPRLEMTFTCKAYKDFPVLEWKSSFRNPSGQKSDRLSQVKSVVFRHIREQKRLTMTRRRGAFLWHPLDRNSLFPYPDSDSVGNGFRNSYQPVEDILFAGQSWHISATDGRPTDEWLPCVDLNDGNTNFRIAVGWAGQWGADISYDGLNFELSAGVEELDAELEPGEQLDLPSVIFLQSEGEAGTVINLWRRFLTEKIMPKINGVPPVVPLSFMTWGGMSEKQQMKKLAVIDREDLHPEVYWIDAGWFAPESLNEHEPTWSNNVGDWDFDPVSFPEELRNISREVHRQNG